MHTDKTKDILRKQKQGTKNPNWKGDNAGYNAIHNWVTRHYGQPKICKICGKTDKKRYEWANISGLYKRNIKDWERLCCSCHQKKDKAELQNVKFYGKGGNTRIKKSDLDDFLEALGINLEE